MDGKQVVIGLGINLSLILKFIVEYGRIVCISHSADKASSTSCCCSSMLEVEGMAYSVYFWVYFWLCLQGSLLVVLREQYLVLGPALSASKAGTLPTCCAVSPAHTVSWFWKWGVFFWRVYLDLGKLYRKETYKGNFSERFKESERKGRTFSKGRENSG